MPERVSMIEALQLAAQFCEEHVDAGVPKPTFDKYDKSERPNIAAEKLARIRQVADDIVKDSRRDLSDSPDAQILRDKFTSVKIEAKRKYESQSGSVGLTQAFIDGYFAALTVIEEGL